MGLRLYRVQGRVLSATASLSLTVISIAYGSRIAGPVERIRGRIQGMQARKIQVKNGRLVLDEPTDLPEGAEVEVLVIDDELTAEERAALHASLDRALDDSEAGRGIDAWEFLDRYRARREDRPAR